MPALQRGKRLSASQIAVRAQFVCAWRPRTLRPSRHQPGIAPHDFVALVGGLVQIQLGGSDIFTKPAHVTSHDGKRIPVTAAFYRARPPWTLFAARRGPSAPVRVRGQFGNVRQSATELGIILGWISL